MDILHLVDRLEALLREGWRIPLTSNVLVDEDDYLDIIDQMRISIPEEIKQARRIQQERERIIAQAQEEAERVVALARERAEDLMNEHDLLREVESRRTKLLEEAQREAEGIRADADEYVIEVLSELEEQLNSFLKTVRNGLATLRERRARRQGEQAGQVLGTSEVPGTSIPTEM